MINYIGRTILDVIFGETFLHLDLTRLENLVTAADFLIFNYFADFKGIFQKMSQFPHFGIFIDAYHRNVTSDVK